MLQKTIYKIVLFVCYIPLCNAQSISYDIVVDDTGQHVLTSQLDHSTQYPQTQDDLHKYQNSKAISRLFRLGVKKWYNDRFRGNYSDILVDGVGTTHKATPTKRYKPKSTFRADVSDDSVELKYQYQF